MILNFLSFSCPLLLASTGALFSEYTGTLALFLEGFISFSGFLTFYFTVLTGSVAAGLSLGMMSAGSPVGENAGMSSYIWSLNNYKEKIEESEEAEDLDRSIVASLADEVLVSIVGSTVQIDIIKAF